MVQQTDLTIIIVNYNVKEFLAHLLFSIRRASHHLDIKIFIVDNASSDGSQEYITERFPEVNYIYNEENVGFGKANNQVIREANSRYTLLVNPDVIISEDTLTTMIDYLDMHPDCGAAGCKILNADGTFAPESRRTVPTISSSLYKVFGLNRFSGADNKKAQYYVNWVDEDQRVEIPVLSGAFMFFRTDTLQKLDGFDERFFMYGEDIDLCYRLQNTGKHIMYLPDTSIIHFKGESSRKNDLKYIKHFNEALYLFFDKHYSNNYSLIFKILIYAGIVVKALLSLFTIKSKKYSRIIADVAALNVSLFIAYITRVDWLQNSFNLHGYVPFLWIHGILTFLYITFGLSFNLDKKSNYPIAAALKSLYLSYSGVVLITFFIRSLAYSRLILLIGIILNTILVLVSVFIRSKLQTKSNDDLFDARVLIVGLHPKTNTLISRIGNQFAAKYNILGLVSDTEEQWKKDQYSVKGVPLLGSMAQLPVLVDSLKVDQIFFVMNKISYKSVVRQITLLADQSVIVKIIPDDLNYIIGKSNVEYFQEIPVVDLDLPFLSIWNRYMKRGLDIVFSLILILLLSPLVVPLILFNRNTERFDVSDKLSVVLNAPVNDYKVVNIWRLLGYVLIGRLSIVGTSASSVKPQEPTVRYPSKPGITSAVYLNTDDSNIASNPENREQIDMHYLQNYSIWVDIEIMIKSLVKGRSILSVLD